MHRCLLVAPLFISMLSCQDRPPPIEPVIVGHLRSEGGDLAALGESLAPAVTLAVEQINAGGGLLGGRPLQLLVADTQSVPSIAAEQAQQLITAGAVAMVGPESSGQSLAVIEVAERSEVPMVSCCATSAALSSTAGARSGYFFRTAPSDDLQSAAIAWLARNGFAEDGVSLPVCEYLAIFTRSDGYGTGFGSSLNAAYRRSNLSGFNRPGAIVAEGSFATADNPPQGEIEAAALSFANEINDGLEAAEAAQTAQLCVAFITFGSDGATFVSSLDARLNRDAPVRYLTGDGARDSSFRDALRTSGVRSRITGTVPFHATNAAFGAFQGAYRARFGGEPPAYAAQSYDAVMLSALAIEVAGRAEAGLPTGRAIRDALFDVNDSGGIRFADGEAFPELVLAIGDNTRINYVGPSGEADFDPYGNVAGDYVLWQVGDTDFVDQSVLRADVFTAQ